MNIVDDYTSYPWSIPLKMKDEAFSKLVIWQCERETETGLKVGIYRTDNGELKSDQMADWLASRGIAHQYTASHTSAHIGHVERMHRTLMAKARTMRIYADLPSFLWDELYLMASHLHAKTTTHSLGGKTAWELWFGKKPDYSYMCEIGCRAFVLILNRNNPKIYERSIECVLIGYDARSKCYWCYDQATKWDYSSYHVRFLESYEGHSPTNNSLPSCPIGWIYASNPRYKSNIFQSLFNSFKPLSKHQNHSKIFSWIFCIFTDVCLCAIPIPILHTVRRFVLLLPPQDLILSKGSTYWLVGSARQVGCLPTKVLKCQVNRYMRVKQSSRMASLLSVFTHWGVVILDQKAELPAKVANTIGPYSTCPSQTNCQSQEE